MKALSTSSTLRRVMRVRPVRFCRSPIKPDCGTLAFAISVLHLDRARTMARNFGERTAAFQKRVGATERLQLGPRGGEAIGGCRPEPAIQKSYRERLILTGAAYGTLQADRQELRPSDGGQGCALDDRLNLEMRGKPRRPHQIILLGFLVRETQRLLSPHLIARLSDLWNSVPIWPTR